MGVGKSVRNFGTLDQTFDEEEFTGRLVFFLAFMELLWAYQETGLLSLIMRTFYFDKANAIMEELLKEKWWIHCSTTGDDWLPDCFSVGQESRSQISGFSKLRCVYSVQVGRHLDRSNWVSHTMFECYPEDFFDFYKKYLLYPNAKPNAAHRYLTVLKKPRQSWHKNIDSLM